jgi:hypothetical protein
MSDEFHPATLPHEKPAVTPPLDRMSKTGKTSVGPVKQPPATHGLPRKDSDMSGMLPSVNRKTKGEDEADVLKDKARAVQRKPDHESPEEQKAEATKKRREKDEKERQDEKVDREIGETRRRRKERNEKERGSPHKAGEETRHGEGEEPTLVSAFQRYQSLHTLHPFMANRIRVRWAPLNVPLPRRLQTAAVLWHTLAMSIFFSLFWFTLAIPLSWPILVPYLIYVLLFARNHLDGTVPYRRSEFLRNLPLWRFYAEYFPIRIHRTAQLDASKNYIFAYHPHGIISHGAFGNFATEATGFSQLFPGIKNTLLTLDTNFNIPFYREYLLSMGLASVSRESCEALLRGDGAPKNIHSHANPPAKQGTKFEGGRAITIVIGGAQESLEAQPGTMKLLCKKRRGFLKLAIREGAGVVPVLSFGENGI